MYRKKYEKRIIRFYEKLVKGILGYMYFTYRINRFIKIQTDNIFKYAIL